MKKYAQRSFFKARFRRPERVSEGAGSVCTGACDVAGRGRVVVVVMSSARFVQHGLEVLQHQLASGVEPFLLRSEEHTSELQSRGHLVCRLLLEKKKTNMKLCV